MASCWSSEPASRPDFPVVVRHLEAMLGVTPAASPVRVMQVSSYDAREIPGSVDDSSVGV
jgi:hypothetical protein